MDRPEVNYVVFSCNCRFQTDGAPTSDEKGFLLFGSSLLNISSLAVVKFLLRNFFLI